MKSSQSHTKHHKLIIIGSGPAGLTAGVYSGRAQLRPLIFEGPTPGGQLMGTTHVENWPGNISILGPELMANMRAHAEHAGATLITEQVTRVNLASSPFEVATSTQTYSCDALIVATGATPKRLACPGEKEYWGKGISTCAVCDGILYANKRVIVVGGGDTAMEDASYLAKFTKEITIVHIRDKLTASAPMQQRILSMPFYTMRYNATITSVRGNGERLTHVTITDNATGTAQEVEADGLFVAIGLTPNSAIPGLTVALSKEGYITTEQHNTYTSVKGVFAAGDVVDPHYRQAVTAAGDGCRAALDAERYLAAQ